MKKIDFLNGIMIAHRGYHNFNLKVAENSMEAFKRAVMKGYCIELDVRLLKDMKMVVFHDNNLKRACKVNKLINDCTYDEIKKLKLFNTSSNIPLLEDVLKMVNGRVPIIIETKYYPKYGVLEKKLLNCLSNYKGKIAIQSFYPKSLFWFKKNAKNIPIGLLSSDFRRSNSSLKKLIGKTVLFDIFLKTDFISFYINALPNSFIETKRKNKFILGWTVKSKKDYDKAIKYCDNVICDNIDYY